MPATLSMNDLKAENNEPAKPPELVTSVVRQRDEVGAEIVGVDIGLDRGWPRKPVRRHGLRVTVLRATSVVVGLALLAGTNTALAAPRQVYIDVRLIAVSTRDLGVAQIWSFNLDGSDGHALTKGPAAHYSPKVSPDGAHVAFTAQDGSTYSIYSMDIDGSHVVRLTRPPMSAGTPAWSMNGMQIVFTGAQSSASSYQIWSMNADGSGQKQITHLSGSSASQPAFAPSGAEIAFTNIVTHTSGAPTSRIYTMNVDGSALAPLTAGPGDGYASWADDMQILFARATPDGTTSQVFRKRLSGEETLLSPAGAFFTEPQPSADGTTYIATGRAGSALGLFRLSIDGGTSPGAGTPISIAGGGDTYNPVLIAAPAPPAPSPSGGGVAPSAPASPVSAAPSGAVSIAVPPGSNGGLSLNVWEILIGVGIFVVVIGGITYFVKLRPEKDGCDQQRAAVLAAEAEFEAAQAAFNAAEAVHNQAVAARHNADAQVNWVSDQPAGPKVEQAKAAQAAAVSAETEAYKALVKAGTRQGAARINLDVARKRLADCEELNGLMEEAWNNPPPPPEPFDPRAFDVPKPTWLTDPSINPKTGKPYPTPPPDDGEGDDEQPPDRAPSADKSEPVDPDHIPIFEGPGFDPVPPSPPPEVKPPVDDREIG
jgi:hypothetical protein